MTSKSYAEHLVELDAFREKKEPWILDDQNFRNCTSVEMVKKQEEIQKKAVELAAKLLNGFK